MGGLHETLEKNPSAADGLYTIDPDGEGANAPFDVYCDMTTDGGGWTLIAVSSDGQATWTWNNRHYWDTDTTTFGNLSNLSEDFKSPALHNVVMNDMLFIHAPSGDWAGKNNVSTTGCSFGDEVALLADRFATMAVPVMP